MPASGNAPMQAGALRRRLTILSSTTTSNAGGYDESATVVLTTWGKVTVKPGNQLLAAIAGQMMARAQYIIEIRYPPSVTIRAGMRVQDGAKTYRIHDTTDVDERHRTMQLTCVEEPAS